jgi:hypothetical protein
MTIISTFCKFLDEDDWRYQVIEDKEIIRFSIQSETTDFDCVVDIEQERNLFVVYLIAPNRVPASKRTTIAEFMVRANYGLVLGCFEMDMDDGEIRFRVGMRMEDSELTPAMCKAIIYTSLATLSRFYGGLMAVIFGDMTPTEVIAKIEEKKLKDSNEDIKAKLENLLEVSPDELSDEV